MTRAGPTSKRFTTLLLVMLGLLPACAARGRDVQSGYVRVAGGDSLWYDVQGTGPPVVLLHGGFIDSRLWDEQVKLPGFRWIRYDIRGFGRSPLPRATYAPVGDVRALLDRLGVRRAVLVGLSMGSSYALDFALEHPDRVAGLMLIAAGPSGQEVPQDAIDRIVELWTIGRARGARAAAERWLEHPMVAATMSNPASAARMRALALENGGIFTLTFPATSGLQRPAIQRMGEVRVPTLAVMGAEDTDVNRSGSELLARGIPGARLESVAGAAHMIPLERRDVFNALLLDFLRGIPAW